MNLQEIKTAINNGLVVNVYNRCNVVIKANGLYYVQAKNGQVYDLTYGITVTLRDPETAFYIEKNQDDFYTDEELTTAG